MADYDPANCWPRARQAIREAALAGKIQIHGYRSAGMGTDASAWHSVRVPIPSEYWTHAEISALATDAQFAEYFGPHTFPEKLSDGKFTKEQMFLYARLTADWGEAQTQWP